jgi:hypothetical protein
VCYLILYEQLHGKTGFLRGQIQDPGIDSYRREEKWKEEWLQQKTTWPRDLQSILTEPCSMLVIAPLTLPLQLLSVPPQSMRSLQDLQEDEYIYVHYLHVRWFWEANWVWTRIGRRKKERRQTSSLDWKWIAQYCWLGWDLIRSQQ